MVGSLFGEVELGWTFPMPDFQLLPEGSLDAFSVPPDAYLFSEELTVLTDAGLDSGVEGTGVPQGRGHFIPFRDWFDPD